jgi:uncharacterized membrane protein
MRMTRAILIGGAAGAAIGAVGYDLEIIVQGQATVWNYVLFACGVAGLLVLWGYRRRLTRSLQRTPR